MLRFKINGGQQKHVTGPLRLKLMVGNKNTLPTHFTLKFRFAVL